MKHTWVPAHGFGAPSNFPSVYWHLKAHCMSTVFVTIVKWATWDILARASPRKPCVPILVRSSNFSNLLVVNLSQTIAKSSLLIPVPLSWIFSSLRPPSLTVIWIDVDPASKQFSISSFKALAGLWITSPAAMRLTTTSSNFWMCRGFFGPPSISKKESISAEEKGNKQDCRKLLFTLRLGTIVSSFTWSGAQNTNAGAIW